MDLESAKTLIQNLSGAFKSLRLYPPKHPAVGKQLSALAGDLHPHLRGRSTLRIGLLQETLFVDEHLLPDSAAANLEFARLLKALDLGALEFYSGVSETDLRTLLDLLTQGQLRGEAFSQALSRSGVQTIRALTELEEQPLEPPRKIYQRAMQVVDHVFEDVRQGRIPSTVEAEDVVKAMVRQTIADPHALFALSLLKDYDNYTFTHSVNVSVIALTVGRACGLEEDRLRILGLGGLFHDLGKLRVDHDIITKPGRLTTQEFEEMKRHPRSGADIVSRMAGVAPEVVDIVIGHHLQYDRAGYPADLKGRPVSPLADMAAIADAYDAMTTLRPYQRPVTPRKAIDRLRQMSGTQLHPQYLTRFIEALGPWPVGSLVRLASSEIALVRGVDTQAGNLTLLILIAADGSTPRRLETRVLQRGEMRQMLVEVDPGSRGIDVASYFD
ncbi:MAG: HD-GYP domain-containing protein [Trichloromonadaceae bacterium]